MSAPKTILHAAYGLGGKGAVAARSATTSMPGQSLAIGLAVPIRSADRCRPP